MVDDGPCSGFRRRRDSRVKRFDEGQAGPFEAGEDRFMASSVGTGRMSMDSMRLHMPCMAYSLSRRALASVVFPALDGPLSRITCPMFSHVALASPGRAARCSGRQAVKSEGAGRPA